MKFSKKAEQISPSVTLSITSKAKEMREKGIDVIIFGAGEPDFNTPENIQKAAIEAMKKGYTKYTQVSGITELKTAIIKKFKRDNNLEYSASQIIISTGAKQSLSNAFQALLNPGDEVIIPSPYWVSYPELIKLADGVPIFVSGNEKNNFKYTREALEEALTDKTKAILLNSPNNPTGAVYTRDELSFIAEFARLNDLFIISDEIYENFIYDDSYGEKFLSIAALSEDAYKRTIVINGVSKTYSMTGWRIGYAAADEKIVKLMSNIQSHTTSNPNSIAQYAAAEALDGDQSSVDKMITEFKVRRDYIVEKINSCKNISCIEPAGAFYVMVNISKFIGIEIDGVYIKNSVDFSKLLLDNVEVAVIPGDGFGTASYVRLSYAVSMESIVEGMDRIIRFCEE